MRVALLVGVQDLVVAKVADLRAIKRDLIRSFNGVEKNAIYIVCTIFFMFALTTVLSAQFTKGHSFSQP